MELDLQDSLEQRGSHGSPNRLPSHVSLPHALVCIQSEMMEVSFIETCGLFREAMAVALQKQGIRLGRASQCGQSSPVASGQSGATSIVCICPLPHAEALHGVVRELGQQASPVKCIYIARKDGHALDPHFVMRFLDGLLPADSSIAGLASAIRDVHQGRKVYDASLMAGPPSNASQRLAAVKLADREWHVLQYLAQGFRNRSIAEKLGISEKTVATHRMRLVKKLGIREQHELVNYAREQGAVAWAGR